MEEGEKAGRRARLFLAFALPDPLVAGLTAWQASALVDGEWRPVRAETLHLTLVFLGSRPEGDTATVAEVVAGELPSFPPSIRLLPTAVGIPRRRPRALAFEAAEAPGLGELAERLGRALERAQLHTREQRPFWPHLTVARRRKDRAGARASRQVKIPTQALPPPMAAPFTLDRLVLYRSETLPAGSVHHPQATFAIT